MTNEDLMIELIKSVKTEIIDLKSDMNRRFEEVDKRFDQVDKRFEQVDRRFDTMHEKLRDIKLDMREMKSDIKEESKRVDEIYHDRKNMKVQWSLPFVGFNAGVSACVAFFVSLWK